MDLKAIGSAELVQDIEVVTQLFSPGAPILLEVKVRAAPFGVIFVAAHKAAISIVFGVKRNGGDFWYWAQHGSTLTEDYALRRTTLACPLSLCGGICYRCVSWAALRLCTIVCGYLCQG